MLSEIRKWKIKASPRWRRKAAAISRSRAMIELGGNVAPAALENYGNGTQPLRAGLASAALLARERVNRRRE
jgi:hypothetical protein